MMNLQRWRDRDREGKKEDEDVHDMNDTRRIESRKLISWSGAHRELTTAYRVCM